MLVRRANRARRTAGDDGEFTVGKLAIQRDRVFERDLVVVADHHQGSAADAAEVVAR
jgi:hypothetical protein